MMTYLSIFLMAGVGAAVDAKDVTNLYGDIVLWAIIIFGLVVIISAEMRNPKTEVTFWYVTFSIGASLLLSFLSIGFYLSSENVEKWMLYTLIAASLLFGKEVTDMLMKKAPAAIAGGIIEAIKNLLSGTLNLITKKKSDGNDDL